MRSLLNRRTLWSALAGVVLLAPPLFAQQATVSGRVTDQGTNQPIAGARVQVIGTAVGAVTNAQGTYTLKTSSVGNVELRVVALGFASVTRAAAEKVNRVEFSGVHPWKIQPGSISAGHCGNDFGAVSW